MRARISDERSKNRAYHHGDLKQTLIDAACRQLSKSSAENLSLRALARDAGVSQTAPYRHFKTKNSLFAAIATSGFEEMLLVLNQNASNAGADPIERVIAIGTGYVHWALANPEKYKLFFDSVLVDFSSYQELQAAGDACFQVLIKAIREGVEGGVFADGSIEEMAIYFWASVHGIASLLLAKSLKNDENTEAQKTSATALSHLRNHSRDVIKLSVAAISR